MKNIYGDFIWVLMRTATLHDKDGKPLLLIKVIGKENLICFEVPLKYDIIRHLNYSTVSVLTYNYLVNQIIECAGYLTIFIVADGNYNNTGLSRYTSAIVDRLASLEDNTPTEIISYTDAKTNDNSVAAMVRVGGQNGIIALASCPVSQNADFWVGTATSPIVGTAVLLAVICIAAAIVIPSF